MFLSLVLVSLNSFSQAKSNYYKNLNLNELQTGVFYNLATPYSHIEYFDGSNNTPELSYSMFKQIYYEIFTASISKSIPDVLSLIDSNAEYVRNQIIPIYVVDYEYDIIKNNALTEGLLFEVNNQLYPAKGATIFETKNVFVASILSDRTYGLNVNFQIPTEKIFSNTDKIIDYFVINFDDNQGDIIVNSNDIISVNYNSVGEKSIKLTAVFTDNTKMISKFLISVKGKNMPTPDDYWDDFTADIDYNGLFGTANVAIFYGSGNTTLTEPVIIVDGFDPGDTRPMEGLYELVNQQDLVDTLRSRGLDLVLVNFYEGAGFIQQNAFLMVKIIQTVNQIMEDDGTMLDADQVVVVGPSMGGIITRYAITYMEQNGLDHNIRNWVSFDSPQKGANIPLGLQHWVRFYADEAENEGAIEGKAGLNSPAARQMLVYHFTATSGYSANPHSTKVDLYNELDVLGFPEQTRIVSIINGSGYGITQPYDPGEKVVGFYYRSFTVDLDGDIWAVPNQTHSQIFEGLYDTALPFDEVSEDIYVNNTLPYDNAPGGDIETFREFGEIDPGYGDIIAYYDAHCFIPSISSCALENTTDPMYFVNGNIENLVTPFDKIYYPYENEEHVFISDSSVFSFIHEIYNFQPLFTSSPNLEINEDELYEYLVTATDENEWQTVEFEVVDKPDWLTYDSGTKLFSGTPTNDNVGTHVVTIKITDGLKENFQEFEIEVINTNDAPVVANDLINQSVEANYSVIYTFAENTFEDVDATDELSYTSELSDGSMLPLWLNFDAQTRTFVATTSVQDTGMYQISVIATDLSNESVSSEFSLHVLYSVPVLINMPSAQIYEDSTCSFEIIYTDPLGEDLTNLSVDFSENWVTYNEDEKTLYGLPENDDVGLYDFSITLSNVYHSVTYDFQVEVLNTNDAPTSQGIIDDIIIEANSSLDFFITPTDLFSDVDVDDVLAYSVSLLPSWLIFNIDNFTFSGTPQVADTGIYPITVFAADLAGAYDSINFNIIVNYTPSNVFDVSTEFLQVNLYPNPTFGIVNLQFNSANYKEIYIFDLNGKLVFSDFISDIEKTYNFDNLSKGVYMVQINNNHQNVSKKLIIR